MANPFISELLELAVAGVDRAAGMEPNTSWPSARRVTDWSGLLLPEGAVGTREAAVVGITASFAAAGFAPTGTVVFAANGRQVCKKIPNPTLPVYQRKKNMKYM